MVETILSLLLFLTVASLLALAAANRAECYGDPFTMSNTPSLLITGAAACACVVLGTHGFLGAAPAIVALACLAISAASDLQTGYIFDLVTGSSGILVLLCAAASGNVSGALLGALAAGGVLFVLYILTRGRGMGLGDVKLAAILGAGLGAMTSLIAIGIAFVLGATIVVACLLARRMRRGDTVRFGPYLALGAIVLVFVRSIVW